MDRPKSPRWMTCCIVAPVAVVMLAAVVGAQAAEKLPDDLALCLSEAKQANAAHDIELERRLLSHAESLQGDAKDAAEVQRRLAALDWKFQ